MTNRKISVALVGAGFIGKLHAINLSRHPDIDLRYVVEPGEQAGRQIAEANGADWLAEPDTAWSDPTLDAVWIASPASTHSTLIRLSAKAGKAIFCEKPIGMEMPDVDQLLKDVDGFDRPIFVGFNRRFDASHARLKELVDSGAIGKVEMVSITSRDPNPPPAAYMRATPGGIFYDTMIHDFDVARWLIGEEAIEVYATASAHLDREANPDGEYDAATATLKTASGAVCQVTCSRRAVYGYDQRIEVFGSEGMVQSLNHGQSNVQLYGRDAIRTDPLKNFFTDRYAEAYVAEIERFVAAAQGKSQDYPTVLDGRQALFLSLEALKSARTGKPIPLT